MVGKVWEAEPPSASSFNSLATDDDQIKGITNEHTLSSEVHHEVSSGATLDSADGPHDRLQDDCS